MTTKPAVQELKAERVQEEMVAVPVRKEMLFVDVADEPVWVSLKAERVQEPTSVAASGKAQHPSEFHVTVSHKQPITIELQERGTVITLHGQPQAA
jgi:hypothetical protein